MADFSFISRRRFLKLALAAGGAVIAGGSSTLLWLRGRAPAVAGLRCLSPHEYRTLAQLARALFPDGGTFPVGASDLDLAATFDGYLADEPAWKRRDLKRALLYLEMAPVVVERRGRTWSHLPEADRLAMFRRWAEGDHLLRRQIALAFGKLLALVFYDQPAVWPHIGYDGPAGGAS